MLSVMSSGGRALMLDVACNMGQDIGRCCRVAKLPFTNNERETKLKNRNQNPKLKQTEGNQKFFLNSEFLKSRSPLQVPVCILL
jgi:hypothetical protein